MSKNKNAFSLIELLVVISIMAILAGIGYISFRTARATARDGRRLADLKNIQTAVETYAADNNGRIPCAGSPMSYKSTNENYRWDTLSELLKEYYSAAYLPVDPQTGSTTYYYEYKCNENDQIYALRAKMERNAEISTDDHGCFNSCDPVTNANCWWEIGSDIEDIFCP